ncbi:NfeD family protein [soil metagenome]
MKWGWIHFLLLALCTSAIANVPATSTAPAAHQTVVIAISVEINEYTQEMLAKHIGQAKQLGADTVILQLDTYGGMVTSGLEMSALLKNQPTLHIIAWVPEKAISAGAMIALACDEIVMGPVAKLCDSAPISISEDGSLQPMQPTERAKFESPILEDFRDSARRHGYDELLAESMVRLGPAIYAVQRDDGSRRFVTQAEYDKLIAAGTWHDVAGLRNPVRNGSELLTLSTDSAVLLGMATRVQDLSSLASARGLTIIATLAPGAGDAFLHWFGSSPVRFLLLVTFLVSLYVAMHIPGHGAPEAIAMISLCLFLGVPLLTGYAQWWEVLVIIIGLALLAFEIFVIPGHGLAAIPGAIIMLFGILMTFVPKEPSGLPGFLPSLQGTWAALQNGLVVMVAGLFSSLLLGAWLRRFLPKLPFFSKLILSSPVGTFDSAAAVTTNTANWPAPGARGRTETDLKPGGSAAFIDPAAGDRQLFSVVSDRGFIPSGTEVVVQEVGGGRLVVRPV